MPTVLIEMVAPLMKLPPDSFFLSMRLTRMADPALMREKCQKKYIYLHIYEMQLNACNLLSAHR